MCRRLVSRRALVLGTCLLALLPLVRSASPAPTPRVLPPLARPFAALERGLLSVAAPRHAAAACDGAVGVVCSVVGVPLDRTGAVPGTIPLHVEILTAAPASRARSTALR